MQPKPPVETSHRAGRVHPISAADEHLFSISGYSFVVRGPVGTVQNSKLLILRCNWILWKKKKNAKNKLLNSPCIN